jgi:hypothetical protein
MQCCITHITPFYEAAARMPPRLTVSGFCYVYHTASNLAMSNSLVAKGFV